MASTKGKQWRSLIVLAVLLGGLWSLILVKGWDPVLGLDLQGGISVILEPTAGQDVDEAGLEKAVEIIQNRVDGLGVAEPDIAVQGGNISVQLPGLKDQAQALSVIGTTAKLSFRPVLELLGTADQIGEDKEKQLSDAGLTLPTCGDAATYAEDDPDQEVVFCLRPQGDESLPPEQWLLARLGKTALEGSDVATAGVDLSSGQLGGGAFSVTLDLTREGGRKFKDITGKLACNQGDTRQLAIVLDGVIESSPQAGTEVKCNEGIGGGNATITGNFSEDEARGLALILRYGALPIELDPSTTTTISPSLGKESLRDGLLAGFIGLGIVFLYVLFFYRALGILIWIGIALHGFLTLAVIIILGETAGFALSLAGIAGLIVSLGIAADSFIVYFERIKDEVASTRTVKTAVDRAWPSAWRTILAADLVTALAAIVLYFLAVGSVRGFALTLGLATALDLFISRLFMHPAVTLFAGTRFLRSSRTLGYGAPATRAPAQPVGGEA